MSGGFLHTLQRAYNYIKVVPYGIYSTPCEVMLHFGYLVYGALLQLVCPTARTSLETEIKDKFRSLLRRSHKQAVDEGHVLLTHSCRTLFYCVVKSLLAKKHKKRLKICTGAVQFGSFYRILKQIELSDACAIELYEIDFAVSDFTMDTFSMDEAQVASCDLILVQHLFGVPMPQSALFRLARKLRIPIVEDCVQSGSLFSKYQGNAASDVCFWSGGLDKTPSCFGGGFGYFKNSPHGNALYKVSHQFETMLVSDLFSGSSIFIFVLDRQFFLGTQFCSLKIVGTL